MPTHASFNPHDLLDHTIGDYQLCELLGSGNAFVYRALDKGKGEYVALKLVAWPGAAVDDIALRRFAREIRVLRERHHAAIVPIYDWHPSGDYVYVTMEYCEGTLQRWLREHRPNLTEVLQIVEPLAAALDFLHTGTPPVIHRDVKPANILFKGRHWYLSDFSIARMEADPLLTTDGTTLGTLRYAAPEQITGAKTSAETDIYSFGLLVYEMLAGGWMLGARRAGDWAYEVPPISGFQRGLPPAVDALFARWLAPRPADRPHRASDAVRELAAAAGVLRNPALARLYDLATVLAERPHDAGAWRQAQDLLATIALHEPAFFDPRGLAAHLASRLDGAVPGPPPPGYSGRLPPTFYTEQTVIAPRDAGVLTRADPDGAAPPDESTAPMDEATPRLLPAADAGTATFAPRTRYDASSTLQVPANSTVAGSVFGRNVVLEADAHVAGDVYSLGDLTLGAGAVVDGLALGGGTLTAAARARIGGAAGAHADTIHLGPAVTVAGWALADAALDMSGAATARGLIAGASLGLAGSARVTAPTVGSVSGALTLSAPAELGGAPAGPEHLQDWAAGPPGGRVLTSLLTGGARARAEQAQHAVAGPAALTAPQPVAPADPPTLQTSPATPGPTLYLPSALQIDPDAPPAGLPADPAAWEGPLAGAWLLDQLWTTYLRQIRAPAIALAALTLLAWAGVAWLVLHDLSGTAGALLLAWLVLLLAALVAWWLLRPRPLELVRLWWAWETWGLPGGVLVWDTLDPGEDPGYLEPAVPLAPLAEQAAQVAGAGADPAAILERMAALHRGLAELPWKAWPGVFASRPPDRDAPDVPGVAAPAAALLHLVPVMDEPAADVLPRLQVLAPCRDPEVVRAAADRLAGWPGTLATARGEWRIVGQHLQTLDPVLDGWDATAQTAAQGAAAAQAALAGAADRAAALAEETLAALEHEVAPEIDQLWTLHVEAAKLIGAYFTQAQEAQRAAGRREQDRAAARVAAEARTLRGQETTRAELEAALRPLADRWQELGAAHDRAGMLLRQEWKRARTQLQATAAEREGLLTLRSIDLRQAADVTAQLEREIGRLASQAEDFLAECVRGERDWPADLVWPPWPARLTAPLAVEVERAALDNLLRRLRAEPGRARTRLETLRTLLPRTTLALERALGVQQVLAAALAAAGADPLGEAGQWRSVELQINRLVGRLRPLHADLGRWQRRFELTSVVYADVIDLLTQALKGGRNGPAWEQGQRLQAESRRLETDLAAATAARDESRLALAAAQDAEQHVLTETDAALARLAQGEQDLVARSEEHAGQEEIALRRHVAQLRARHDAVIATLAPRRAWIEALAAFDAATAALKIEAVDRLRERIQILAAFADGRMAETADARAAALWPLDLWPADDMLYLLPVWLLRYRPLGWRQAPRLLAVTPGRVRRAAQRGRRRPATGFVLDPQPALGTRFAEDLLDAVNEGAGALAPLAGDNLLAARAPLAAQWQGLAAAGLVAPWLARLLAVL